VFLVVFIEHLVFIPADLPQKPSGSFTEMMRKNSFSLSQEKKERLTEKSSSGNYPHVDKLRTTP